MTTEMQIANVLTSVLSIGLIWWMYAVPFRRYRIDLFRQRLFAARDELFDMAVRNELEFNDPSYRMLRQTLNGFIRFADTLGFGTAVIFLLQLRPSEKELEERRSFLYRWEELKGRRAPEVDKKLQSIVMNMHMEVIEQLIVTSPLLIVVIIPLVASVAVKHMARHTLGSAYTWCRKHARTAWVDVLDSAAFEMGEDAPRLAA